jgi:hypothetical protein
MKFFKLLLFISTMFFLAQCNTGEQSPKSSQAVVQQPAQPTGPQIPSIPKEIMSKLYNECTYTDYIFFDLPFSMSQDEKYSIRANLNYISVVALGTIPTNCKAMGRQFFHIEGDIVLEANVYFEDGCQFYVFVDGETPLYANLMSDKGIEFYSTMIQQAIDSQKAAGLDPVH